MASYTAIFQGMRIDQPGGAPNVGVMFKGVFRQVRRGEHTLTDYGKLVVGKMETLGPLKLFSSLLQILFQ